MLGSNVFDIVDRAVSLFSRAARRNSDLNHRTGPGRKTLYTWWRAIERKHASRYPMPVNPSPRQVNCDNRAHIPVALKRAERWLRRAEAMDLDPMVHAPGHIMQKIKILVAAREKDAAKQTS